MNSNHTAAPSVSKRCSMVVHCSSAVLAAKFARYPTCSHIKCESPNDCDFWQTQKQFWRCSTEHHSKFSHVATVDLFLSGKGVLNNVELQLILRKEISVFTTIYSWYCVVMSFAHSVCRSQEGVCMVRLEG